MDLSVAGLECIRRTIEELAIDCDYQVQDSIFVARTVHAEIARALACGLPAARAGPHGMDLGSWLASLDGFRNWLVSQAA